MIVAATGHRPDKLGGYGEDVLARLTRGARRYMQRHPGISRAISGMALGWDTAWALAALDLGVPLTAAVAFAGQEGKWPIPSRDRYDYILARATEVVFVSPGGYAPRKMQVRNEWMVDRADRIVALWNGSPGGTANCVAYAKAKRKTVDNLWPEFAANNAAQRVENV